MHDGMISASERRLAPRAACTDEVVLMWLDDPSPVRYGVLDRSDGGFRIRSAVPALTGSLARVLRLLPTGEPVNKTVMVAWSRAVGEGFELGLRVVEGV